MSQFGFPFVYKKATQALNFFAQQAGGRLSKLRALKLVFFADRYHLRKYGRLVTNDEYWAMDYGPVASNTKDLAELSAFLGEQEKAYATKFLEPADSNHRMVRKLPWMNRCFPRWTWRLRSSPGRPLAARGGWLT